MKKERDIRIQLTPGGVESLGATERGTESRPPTILSLKRGRGFAQGHHVIYRSLQRQFARKDGGADEAGESVIGWNHFNRAGGEAVLPGPI